MFLLYQVDTRVRQFDISEITRRNVSIPETDLQAFAISFTLRDRTAPRDIINSVRNVLPQVPTFGVLAFQPSGKISIIL